MAQERLYPHEHRFLSGLLINILLYILYLYILECEQRNKMFYIVQKGWSTISIYTMNLTVRNTSSGDLTTTWCIARRDCIPGGTATPKSRMNGMSCWSCRNICRWCQCVLKYAEYEHQQIRRNAISSTNNGNIILLYLAWLAGWPYRYQSSSIKTPFSIKFFIYKDVFILRCSHWQQRLGLLPYYS